MLSKCKCDVSVYIKAVKFRLELLITLNRHCTKYPETYKKKHKQLYSQIPYKQPPLASSRLITGCLKLQMSFQRLICPRGKNKMPSAYVKFDGHMTISGIFGNEQFPVVNQAVS